MAGMATVGVTTMELPDWGAVWAELPVVTGRVRVVQARAAMEVEAAMVG